MSALNMTVYFKCIPILTTHNISNITMYDISQCSAHTNTVAVSNWLLI